MLYAIILNSKTLLNYKFFSFHKLPCLHDFYCYNSVDMYIFLNIIETIERIIKKH